MNFEEYQNALDKANELYWELHHQITSTIKRRGLMITQVSELSGFTCAFICNILQDKRKMSLEAMKTIAKALNLL